MGLAYLAGEGGAVQAFLQDAAAMLVTGNKCATINDSFVYLKLVLLLGKDVKTNLHHVVSVDIERHLSD